MKAFVFVEGQSDVLALNSLWSEWRERLQKKGHGIRIIHFLGKDKFFQDFGPRGAEKLVGGASDLVVGLPDLHPMSKYENTNYRHSTLDEIKNLQRRLIRDSLLSIYGCDDTSADTKMERFFPSALKYDLEMLLLAAVDRLRSRLKANENFSNRWRLPVEDQNDDSPPKQIVKELFRTKLKREYQETVDAPEILNGHAILQKQGSIRSILRTPAGQVNCPEFTCLIDWLDCKLGVPCDP